MKKHNTLLKKANQAGSMMIEALAMLTLISLVTPTLYKKSAERTTELQDINTASQVRTLTKAVDNYTLTNYQSLLEQLGENASSSLTISQDDLKSYLPYGYNFGALKNFDAPTIVVKRQADTTALTSFVVLPKNGDVNDYRASQIASMIGANGGYVTQDNNKQIVAKGVGGVWSLSNNDLQNMLGSNHMPERGSLVAASSEIINEASRAAFENSKYLQRTSTENEQWRNTMMTDLYMGGVPDIMEGKGDIPYSKILGVDQLIIGDIRTDGSTDQESSDFVLRAHDGREGSAFIQGSLYALGSSFSVSPNAEKNPELNFANSLLKATKDHFSVNVTQGPENDFYIAKSDDNPEPTATFNVATIVDNTFETSGNTSLANDLDSTLTVGPTGDVMTADKYTVNIQKGNLVVTNDLEGNGSSMKVATDTVDIKGSTKIGEGEVQPQIEDLSENMKLNVQGNTFIAGKLEAEETNVRNMDALSFTAGGKNYTKDADGKYARWLNVDQDGVVVKELNGVERMKILSGEATIYGPYLKDSQGTDVTRGSMHIGDRVATLQGVEQTQLSTTMLNGNIELQRGAISLNGSPTEAQAGYPNPQGNSIQMQAGNVKIFSSDGNNLAFQVTPGEGGTNRTASSITNNVDDFAVQKGNKQLLRVVSGENGSQLRGDAVAEIDPTKFGIWASTVKEANSEDNVNNRIFEVNAESGNVNEDGSAVSEASVYVRRGAIELESSPTTANSYDADEGVGYIEASRLVANNLTETNTVIRPQFANSSKYEAANAFDRYMVNPAYTSVMHDIKLTTRGGARLSDILPDFINKGIYIVNNTYEDGVNFNNLHVEVGGNGQLSAQGVGEAPANGWASPFLGMIPAPICPPGHAKVITLMPASFQMAQTGDMVINNDGRYYVQENQQVKKLKGNRSDSSHQYFMEDENRVVTPSVQDALLQRGNQGSTENLHLYYLGMAPDTQVPDGHSATYSAGNTPKPLYFQQSTWLKTKTIAYASTPCNQSFAANGTCTDFKGWATVMGFIYPYSLYSEVIETLKGTSGQSSSAVSNAEDTLSTTSVYWNIFPVRTMSMEAYATVYCYFDRTNIFNSGNNPSYVDQYDQLRNFRNDLYRKSGGTVDGQGSSTTNESYIKRLNDPQLKYNDPW
ncbi:MAG: hypothetical protein J6W11_00970 [Alphaproteobacteria bacterium]|nr:hypothetical protein [Alphaproteobacteria bacterium]